MRVSTKISFRKMRTKDYNILCVDYGCLLLSFMEFIVSPNLRVSVVRGNREVNYSIIKIDSCRSSLGFSTRLLLRCIMAATLLTQTFYGFSLFFR